MLSNRGVDARIVARVALVLVCCGVTADAAQERKTEPSGTITVRLTGFKDATGAARVALATSGQFLGDRALRAASVAIKDGRAIAVFERVPYGSYAVQAYEDRNGNRKLDRNFFGIPSEPYGFSNGARNAMGPPKFADAAFTLAAPALTVDVRVVQ
jgi:uncharacterized protein (DUF2141 family)